MTNPEGAPRVPPPQHNFQDAAAEAVQRLADQSHDQLRVLGATGEGDLWKLPVLDDVLTVELSSGSVRTSAGEEVRPPWRILVLHYLCCRSRPRVGELDVTFADLPGGRVYAVNYDARVIRRLCATVGREAGTLTAAAEAVGGRRAEGADLAFEFDVFPHLTVRLLWYAADEEFDPTATVLLPRDVEGILCIEDVVVLSEQLVSRLSGRPF
ncbi:MAG: DUF3786 domain-containing protein [Planctomycetota bacterium]|jgi:hypothetical protein